MATYQEIKNRQPELVECFFAFSDQQFGEGIKKNNLEGKKIYRGMAGLYGTHEGIKQLYDFYDNLSKEIGEKCNPQEVYDYEFGNHECGYVGDDAEAMKIVISYFKPEQYNEVKRKCKYFTNEQLLAQIEKEAQRK